MTIFLTARFNGNRNLNLPFTKGSLYPIAATKHWWSKRVRVYQRRGWNENQVEGSQHTFFNREAFETAWIPKEIV